MKKKLYLLYLDSYHQGDPLFLKELAQSFARTAPGEPPALLLHGGGEKLERTLEAEGLFPERQEGVLVAETPRQAALAERAAREANQELVALFTDEEVSAVGLQGADRGLLRVDDVGEVAAGALGWVEDLIKMRVVPVVSALAAGPEHIEAVPPVRASIALAEALDAFDVTLCFLAKGALPDAETVTVDALPEGVLAEPETVRQAARVPSLDVLVADLRSFFSDGGPQGLRIEEA